MKKIMAVVVITIAVSTQAVQAAEAAADNIVWGTIVDNIVWGTGVVLALLGF